MSKVVTLEEAQTDLPDLLAQVAPGEELLIVRDGRPFAKLVREHVTPQPGSAVGMLTIVEDDDEHLKDFEEYMK